jgi:thymidylate kinase
MLSIESEPGLEVSHPHGQSAEPQLTVGFRSASAAHRAGRLIAVEGIDGSGKSTVAGEIVTILHQLGVRAVLVNRRTACDVLDGYPADHLRALRHLIWDYPETARTSALGFGHWAHLLASWFHAVDHTVVRPVLAGGAFVVADSWFYKLVARFALSADLPRARDLFRGISTPDLVVWLDADPEVCVGRRGRLRRTETGEWQNIDGGKRAFVEYQGRVRANYALLASTDAWEVVESLDRPSVTSRVRRRVLEASANWLADGAAGGVTGESRRSAHRVGRS